MADQCIVCLENLDSLKSPLSPSAAGSPASKPAATADPPVPPVPPAEPGPPLDSHNNHDNVAVIQVCGHALHDGCLREWTGKANSCPICRQSFHLVQVYDKVGGKYLLFGDQAQDPRRRRNLLTVSSQVLSFRHTKSKTGNKSPNSIHRHGSTRT